MRKEKVRALLGKYRPYIAYLIFGALTTGVNIAAYALCYHALGIPNVVSNIIAWVLAVIFAFVTNKRWVFDSRSTEKGVVLKELGSFVGARAATGLLDTALMYIGVDLLRGSPTGWKIGANIIVVILNYILSKRFVFRKKEEK